MMKIALIFTVVPTLLLLGGCPLATLSGEQDAQVVITHNNGHGIKKLWRGVEETTTIKLEGEAENYLVNCSDASEVESCTVLANPIQIEPAR